jgi:hypothetical protein
LGIVNKESRSRVRFAGDEGEEELCSDDEFPDYLVPEADMDAYKAQMHKQKSAQVRKSKSKGAGGDDDEDEAEAGAVDALSKEAREALEQQFERTLAEYDDEELGYLEEVSAFGGLGLYHEIFCASITDFYVYRAVARGGYRGCD